MGWLKHGCEALLRCGHGEGLGGLKGLLDAGDHVGNRCGSDIIDG
jgi:hypothetical protein